MKTNYLLPAVIAAVTAVLAISGIWGPDRLFSENENRLLTQKPAFNVDAVRDGSYETQYETYLADQFPGRDAWIGLQTRFQKLLGRKDINGVYLAKDGSLIEQHTPEDVDVEKAQKKADMLLAQASVLQQKISGTVTVLLAPTADNVRTDSLPAFARVYDQETYVRELAMRAQEEAPGIIIPDLFTAMKAHADEYIYYNTDHHWTTLGSFYAWQEYAAQTGKGQKELENYMVQEVSTDFLGTLYSKVNIKTKPDTIIACMTADQQLCTVTDMSGGEILTAGGLYRSEKLKGKDRYAYFMGGNFPLLKIKTGRNTGKTLLLIKDSYANCMIPFLTEDYDTLYVADPRYYRGDYIDITEMYDVTDVLYLYNVIHFIQDYR